MDEFPYLDGSSNDAKINEANTYFQKAYKCQMKGDFQEAVANYNLSIECCPSAEAFTFLGWTYSMMGRLSDAIEECKKAIKTDNTFGNPYNDIGAYLIEMGRFDEAIPWLKKAMKAERYEPRHFPHVNLARVYVLKGNFIAAINHLKKSLEIEPNNPSAKKELNKLLSKLN